MTEYVIRLAMGTEHASRGDVSDVVDVAKRILTGGKPGGYLMWSDPDGNHGKGAETWTLDPVKAKRFKSKKAAIDCYMARSKKIPKRPDGKPNRPMTAYSVSIEEAP